MQNACIRKGEALPHSHEAAPGCKGLRRDFQKGDIAVTTGTNRIMDEFAKMMTDAAGAAQGVKKEIETAFASQAERWLNSMDVVRREEFEAVREMAIKAREENEALKARIEALEAKPARAAKADKPSQQS